MNEVLDKARKSVQQAIDKSQWARIGTPENTVTNAACSILIGRYTAAIAAEFQVWLGATYAFARHEETQYVLKDNIRCEMADNHIGMLHRFAAASKATPTCNDREWVEPVLENIRQMFRDVGSVGLFGTALLATLENTSDIFIPILERAAVFNECTNLTYPNTHGEADAKHSEAFRRAMESERSANYGFDAYGIMALGANYGTDLVLRIFADVAWRD